MRLASMIRANLCVLRGTLIEPINCPLQWHSLSDLSAVGMESTYELRPYRVIGSCLASLWMALKSGTRSRAIR
jgi:hypothetical protein